MYSVAYDAVALANSLAKQNLDDLNQAITNPDGYAGINGGFRLFEDGTNQHSLDIMEIRPNGDVVVEAAPKRFSDNGDNQLLSAVKISPEYIAPRIYGKDKSTAEISIYGEVLDTAGSVSSSEINQRDAVANELKQMNIVIQ